MPTWITADAPDESVTLVFRLQANADQKLTDTRLESIGLPKRQKIALHCGGALDLDGRPLVQLAWAEDDPAPRNFLSWKLDGGGLGQAPHKLGVGAVLLSMASFNKGHLSLGIADEGSPYRRAPLETLLKLEFDNATYTALSMDPELGFETLSDVVERARPWTFDLLEAQPCHLTVEESADQGQSRKLRFELKLLRPGEHKTDVIVVDPSPLTIARVQTSEKQLGDEILAEYLDDKEAAGLKENSVRTIRDKLLTFLPEGGRLTISRERATEIYRAATTRLSRYQRTVTAATHRAQLRCARAFYAWCIERGYLTDNPFSRVKGTGRVNSGKVQLRLDEVRKLVEVLTSESEAGDQGAAALLLLLDVALRRVRILGYRGLPGRPRHSGGGRVIHHFRGASLDRFLAEQGYGYIIRDADDLLGPAI
mgnify:CR=1 FL=1